MTAPSIKTRRSTIMTEIVSQFAFATEYGANGPYSVGIEYTVGSDSVHREIRRPLRRERFIGYGLIDGVGQAVMAVSHDGAMSAWRVRLLSSECRVVEQPHGNPPYLNLPDEEHGNRWGGALEIPSKEPTRYTVAGQDIEVSAAKGALTSYNKTHQVVAPASAAAIALDPGDGNCPTCQLGGVTPERARQEAPRWYAALLGVPASKPTPDEPRGCCWDCRNMIAAGLDPAAIIAVDHAEYRAARAKNEIAATTDPRRDDRSVMSEVATMATASTLRDDLVRWRDRRRSTHAGWVESAARHGRQPPMEDHADDVLTASIVALGELIAKIGVSA
jgi:hypothetical protein